MTKDKDYVENVSITILIDNKADIIVKSNDTVVYFTEKPLLAEHGFSALIQLDRANEKILWDAGVSEKALIENMHRMRLDPRDISIIALSHGHFDHFAGMTTLLKEMDLTPEAKEWGKKASQKEIEDYIEDSKIPIVAHPAAFRERWSKKDDGVLEGPFPSPPTQEWEAVGAKIILSPEPYRLGHGCWTTGYVPRKSFEKIGRPTRLFYRNGSDFLPDDLDEDQAIVINVKDKGLVVLSGCAHSGIVNTINHAKEFTGIDTIYAIVGGFHLARASADEIKKTIDFIKKEKPMYVVPSHCTGFQAISRFAQEMPDEFIEGIVGTTYVL
ncbi:MAG: MBL fold metallo-hydrolase [Anaerolineales bacterium]|jgi:7,8-dihydropterin-6-yl-methyl-4-(beta-D-ribofuranosyl)aminobenzene 5'-phosphate synthase